MTLNHSFLKLMKEDLKRRRGSILLCIYVTFFGMCCIRLVEDFEFSIRSMWVGPGNSILFVMSILFAAILGYGGYSYLFTKQKADFYFTIPVKRGKLFLASYFNGILVFAIINLVCRILFFCFAVSSGRNIMGKEVISIPIFLLGLFLSFLFFLLVYHIVIISCIAAGNGGVAIGFLALLLCYGEVIVSVVIEKYNILFFQNYLKSELLERIVRYLSPVRLCGNMLGAVSWEFIEEDNRIGNWMIGNHYTYLNAVLVCVILTFYTAYRFFMKRAAENAEKAVAEDKIWPLIYFMVTVPAGLMGGYGFCLLAGKTTVLWWLSGLLFTVVLVHGLMEILFHFDAKAFFCHPFKLVSAFLLCIIIGSVWVMAGDGYDSYIPAREKVESVAINIEKLDAAAFGGMQNADIDDRLNVMELLGETKVRACEWIEMLITDNENITRDNIFTSVSVAYRMLDGTTKYRRYEIKTKEMLLAFSEVYQSPDYKKGIKYVPPNMDFYGRNVIWSNGAEEYILDLAVKEVKELAGIYLQDMEEFEIAKLTEEQPMGSLTWAIGSTYTGSRAYFYPSNNRTIAFLKELGIPAEKTVGEYPVKKIRFTYYDDNGKISKRESIAAADKIKEIKARLLPCDFYRNELLNPIDVSIKADVEYTDSINHTKAIAECLLLQE